LLLCLMVSATASNGSQRQRSAVDLKDIKAIIDLMKKNSISEFELERQDFKIRLKRGPNGPPNASLYDESQSAVVTPVPQSAAGPSPLPAPSAAAEVEIKSPMIGT